MNWKKKLAGILLVSSAVVLTIHFINKIINFLATKEKLTQNTLTHEYDWRFGNIHYTKQGTGSPLLLIHDLKVYKSNHEWSKVINSLSRTNTVYCVDLLGCGLSEKSNMTYTNFLYVELISDFIKDVIKEKTNVITSGSSISFVCMTALYNNDLINKIIVTAPEDLTLLSKSPNNSSKTIKFIINTPIIGTFIYNLINNRNKINNILKENYFNSNYVENTDTKIAYESLHLDSSKSKHLFASIKGNYTNISIAHCLSSINNSVYLISGDTEENKLIAEQYQLHMPAIETIFLKQCNKVPQLECSTNFINTVNVLLDTEQ